jgi:hypothetical protein
MYKQERMYVRKRIGRRRSFYRKHRVSIFILACIGTGLLAFALAKVIRRPYATAALLGTRVASDRPELIPNYRPPQNERIVYRYSVIPGGVRSREELAASITSDPVVAKHYADFAVQRASIVRSEETQFVHVSYRIHNNVFWTAKTVKIPKGETLITDGQSSARTRCGNKVSVLPQEPISQEEPPIETFEIPIIAGAEPPPLDLARLPEPALELRPDLPLTPYIGTRPPRILPYYYRPLFSLNTPGIDVPEPGTLSLMFIGLAGFVAVRIMRKK